MDEPYIIRDRQHRQVVLHTAEHVRELLRNDAKGATSARQCDYPNDLGESLATNY